MLRSLLTKEWFFITLAACFILYAVVQTVFFRGRSWKSVLFGTEEELINKIPAYTALSTIWWVLLSTLTGTLVYGRTWTVLSWDFFGYQPNDYGYAFIILGAYFLIKFTLSRLLFGASKSTRRFIYLQTYMLRFYTVMIPVLGSLLFCRVFYFYPDVDSRGVFRWMILILAIIKIIGLAAQWNRCLPKNLYIKILYLCALQIAPIWVVIKLLFL